MLLLLLILVGATFAGCTRPPDPAPPATDERPALADYVGCPWTYPDNTSVDCTNDPMRLRVDEAPPTPSVCVARNESEGWSLHWDPVTEARGVRYEVPPATAGTHATFIVRTDGAEHVFQWDDAPERGYVELPVPVGENVSFRIVFHRIGYATNGTLEPVQSTPVWSLHDRQLWVVHRLEAENATYSFQNVTVTRRAFFTDGGTEPEYRDDYALGGFAVEGRDFSLWVHHDVVHFVRSLVAVPTVGFERFCQIDGG